MKAPHYIIPLVLVISLSFVQAGETRFRDAIQFEDNTFVEMDKLEILHRYERFSGVEPERWDRSEFRYQLRYGILHNFEMALDVPLKFFDNGENGIGDIGIQQRVKFIEQENYPFDLSGGLEIQFPTGDDSDNPPTGTGELAGQLHSTISSDFGNRWQGSLNSAMTFFADSDIDSLFKYNLGVRHRTWDNIKLIGEINGETGGQPDNSELYVSPGVVAQPRDGFSLTLSAPVGITSDSTDSRLGIQFIQEF